MFYQECESLAGKHPELRDLITKIDNTLHSSTPSSVFRPEELASKFNERQSQVTGIFNELANYGLLRKEKYVECPKCRNLMDVDEYKKALADQDTFECTQCQIDLTIQRPDEITVYRLNPSKVKMSSSKNDVIEHTNSQITTNFNQHLPKQLIDDPFKNTPLLRYYSRYNNLKTSKPFEAKRIIFLLHFLKDFIPFLRACEELGMQLSNSYFFFKGYPYPQKESIIKWLKDKNAAIVAPHSHIDQYLNQLNKSSVDRIGKILIIEDGGLIVPAIHNQFPNLIENVIGAVEQTTRGIRNDEQIKDLKFPILSVASSNIKNQFEPPYIAKACINNIQRMLPNIAFNGKNIALLGYGKIGQEIADWLRNNRAIVTIYDNSDQNMLLAGQKGFATADSPSQAAQMKNFVIGASGNESINSDVISTLNHGTYLISASSEQYEIDIDELERLNRHKEELKNDNGELIGTTYILPPNDRHIHVLANGYPINFWGFESMPEEASDLILTLILLSAAELALGNYKEHEINSKAVNEIAEKYEVAKKFLEIHKQG